MLSFKRTVASTLVSAVLSGTAIAGVDLPNYNASAAADVSVGVAAKAAKPSSGASVKVVKSVESAAIQQAVRSGLIASPAAVQFNKEAGVPSVVWAKAGMPKANVSALKPSMQASSAARSYLAKFAPMYGLSKTAAAGAELKNLHDTGKGAIIAKFTQRVNGVEVFGQELNVAMKRDMSLVALTGSLSAQAARYQKVSDDTMRSGSTGNGDFAEGPENAIASAFANLGGTLDVANLKVKATKGDYTSYDASSVMGNYIITDAVRTKPVYFSHKSELEPAYYVEISAGDKHSTDADMYGFVISAKTGKVLFRKNLTEYEFAYKVYADADGINLPWDGPQGKDGQPNPTGAVGYMPANLTQITPAWPTPNLLLLDHGPISTGDPWLLPIASETAGNNVDSYVDAAAPDGYFRVAGDFRADVNATSGSVKIFNYTLDPNQKANASTAQKNAAVVQMFYLNNWMHDWYYDAGFDEKAGNAQANNYGRGGADGDPIKSEAQDYSGANNANMSTPPDGYSPRMQMYFFTHTGDATVNSSAGVYNGQAASFGPVIYSKAGTVVQYQGSEATPDAACVPATNAAALAGKIALVQRGTCAFTIKVKNAQLAGATGVIVYNNSATGLPGMGGADSSITIPSQGISQADGQALVTALSGGAVTATIAVSPSRDSSVDALIMAHEWGHYISNRLIGDAMGLGNGQGRSMGEGWGDFHSLLMTVEKSDLDIAANANWAGVYAQGGYADIDLLNPEPATTFYNGIRRVPYTTDMTKNGLTLSSINTFQDLPAGTADFDTTYNGEVHAAGEVWTTALWECYAALLNDTVTNTFEQAQDKMKRYLVAAYKLTPNNPTFLEARDAVLMAALASSEHDYDLFVQAFAKRGMGAAAQAPERFSPLVPGTNTSTFYFEGAVDDFTTGAAVSGQGASLDTHYSHTYCDDDGVWDAGETALLKVKVRNPGFETLHSLTGQLTSDSKVSFANDGKFTVNEIPARGEVEVEVPVTLLEAGVREQVTFDVTYTSTEIADDVKDSWSLETNYDLSPNLTLDDGNKGMTDWTRKILSGDGESFLLANDLLAGQDPADYIYLGIDNDAASDVVMESPAFIVGADDKLVVTWDQAYSFESSDGTNWDAGRVEYSVDGGDWMDVADALTPVYTGTVDGDNALAGESAYVAMSPSFPNRDLATLDLSGKGLAGKSVKIRFRIASDSNTGAEGWLIDNIDVSGITNKPFTEVVADSGSCTIHAPVAKAGSDSTVKGFGSVTLDASASSDIDQDALTYSWTQTAGTPVTLSHGDTATASFTAGNTAETLTFKVTVRDATGFTSEDDVAVTVVPRKAPVANAGADINVEGASKVTLDASGTTNPENDSLTYVWTQTGGSAVALTGADSATPNFTVGNSNAELQFTVTVTDSKGLSSSDDVVVKVKTKTTTSPTPTPTSSGGGGGGSFGWLGLTLLPLALRRRKRA